MQMWDKVVSEMQTDRTVKQIQDHWCDRQKECIALLESMGPAPRCSLTAYHVLTVTD
jgi:hypothetical protein